MHSELETPIGILTVEWDDYEIEFSCVPASDPVTIESDCVSATFRLARKPPAVGSELSQNGSTFEVIGVRPNGDGYDVRNGNTGVWEKWVES